MVTVAAPFDDQTQIIFPREVDRRDHVFGLDGCNSIGTRRRCPGIDPAGGLRQARLLADVVRILQLLEELATLFAGRCILTRSQW